MTSFYLSFAKFSEVGPAAFLFEKSIEMNRAMPTVSYLISCHRVPLSKWNWTDSCLSYMSRLTTFLLQKAPEHLFYQKLEKPMQALDSDDGGRSTILVHSDLTPGSPDSLTSSGASFSSTPDTAPVLPPGTVSLSQFVITLPEV